MLIEINKDIEGTILDIGGGGEGIITRVFQEQVVAIDNRREELDEAPGGSIKIVMDASNLMFTDSCFDNVTAFYSFMYISKALHQKVISEIKRVLKYSGYLYIWDATITEANPFIAELKVQIPNELISSTYGVKKNDAVQDEQYFRYALEEAGFELLIESLYDGHFYQKWTKRE